MHRKIPLKEENITVYHNVLANYLGNVWRIRSTFLAVTDTKLLTVFMSKIITN